MGAAVVAGGNTAPVLDSAKSVFDAVALTVERFVERDRCLAAWHRRDTSRDAACGEAGPEAIAVIASVGDQHFGRRQVRPQQRTADMIAALAFGQQQDDRSPGLVADGVQF